MKNRINRTKQFVRDHSHQLCYASGLVIGVAVTHHIMSPAQRDAMLHLTKDQVEKLMQNPGDLVCTFDTPLQTVHVVVDAIS